MKFATVLFAGFLSTLSLHARADVTPGGLVAGHYTQVAGQATSLSGTIMVNQAPPAGVPSYYFWASQFWFSPGDFSGYFGLQTGGNIQGIEVGKIALVSVWNAINAVAIAPAVAQTFGGEGIGYSIRIKLDWKQGVPYTFKLERVTPVSSWWKLSVTGGGVTHSLGSIQIDAASKLKLAGSNFTEYFNSISSCNALPTVDTSFSAPRFDGVTALQATDSTPYGNCVAKGRGSVLPDGTIVHTIVQ
ncbi:DUF3472 domain-containing protein [Rhodanobacter sp. Col0626]|uniref:DUF3472 domain-containing protein n=1 Tax=Rhodanobacter sp. Col0626 TaxID=3415679 RepID=UPI003CF4E8A9